MIRLVGRDLQTSFTQFRHPQEHEIGILSCIHFGSDKYLENQQRIIDSWNGVIFEERVTGDRSLIAEIPKGKAGLQFDWQVLFKLLRMSAQRKTLTYPGGSSISSDISFPEVLGLYHFVTTSVPCSPEEQTRVLEALEKNPEEAYTVLWYFDVLLFNKLTSYPERISYEALYQGFKEPFIILAEKLAKLSRNLPNLSLLYDVISYLYLYEPETNFMPERDTSALRNIDVERGGTRRNILLVYGAGHYFGIVRGIYDRRYEKIHESWNTVCTLPQISETQFTEALVKIAESM